MSSHSKAVWELKLSHQNMWSSVPIPKINFYKVHIESFKKKSKFHDYGNGISDLLC